ncbi:MAG: 16S rRNA (uracil(1498)-N(3))-methyltransferase [Treponema sp.]|nr:16S rRNA (uracil(1498)-N(3))-methyltransferase [Treponema sp.]
MKQFILNREPECGLIRLKGDDYHYLVRVRRLAVGEFFPAVLPNGVETLIQVLSTDHGVLTGRRASSAERVPQAVNLSPIILFQALPKGEKMSLIARQAAEGGITEVVPFVSEFSVSKIKEGEGRKFSRWERVIKEARQQSGSAIATVIRPPVDLDGLFDYWEEFKRKGALGLFFHHQPLENSSLHGYLDNNPQLVVLAVGPEGGFSDNEVSRFRDNGFNPLTIGDTILRTETAALYCAAAVRVLLLEKNSWQMKKVKIGSE